MAAAASAVGLHSSPHAVVSKVRANEEGVDLLAHLHVGDIRTGVWVFLGQVTCGASDTWDGTSAEPKEGLWKLRLNTGVDPPCFLAIPYHVEPAHLSLLVIGSKRVVLDRIRLASRGPRPSTDEDSVIGSVQCFLPGWSGSPSARTHALVRSHRR